MLCFVCNFVLGECNHEFCCIYLFDLNGIEFIVPAKMRLLTMVEAVDRGQPSLIHRTWELEKEDVGLRSRQWLRVHHSEM